jgi:hypothetical protein
MHKHSTNKDEEATYEAIDDSVPLNTFRGIHAYEDLW